MTMTARDYVALRQGAEKLQRRPRRKAASKPLEVIVGGDGVKLRDWSMPCVPETANRKLRQHWSERRKERAKWAALLATGGPPLRPAPWKSWVEIHVWRKRCQDPDNAVASVKQLVDALRSRGWIYDDDETHLRLAVIECLAPQQKTNVRWGVLEEQPPRASGGAGEFPTDTSQKADGGRACPQSSGT
jgi:hypothetical protein